MTSRRTRSAVGLLASTACVVLAATPASAASVSLDDATGDVWETTTGFTAAGSVAGADVTGTVVRHLARKVVVTTQLDSLAPEDGQVGTTYRMRFNTGPAVLLTTDNFRAARGETYLYNARTFAPISCRGMTGEISYADDAIVTSAPRTCLGGPRWVEVSTRLDSEVRDQGNTRYYLDSVGTDGHGAGGYTPRATRG